MLGQDKRKEGTEMEVEALRELVSRGSRERPLLASRLEGAAHIVATRIVERQPDGACIVPSEDGLKVYVVSNGACECSDYVRHGQGHYCKHRLAVGLLSRLNGKAQPESAPCTRCGATDEHLCIVCNVCRDFSRHEEDPRHRGRWLCMRCEERASLLGARYGGKGRAGYIVRKLDLGVYGPAERPAAPRLEDLYN
jgi:hypothetical protein